MRYKYITEFYLHIYLIIIVSMLQTYILTWVGHDQIKVYILRTGLSFVISLKGIPPIWK